MYQTIRTAVVAGVVFASNPASAGEFGFFVRGLGKDGYELTAMVEERNGHLKAIRKFACNEVFSYDDPFLKAKVFNCDGLEIYFNNNNKFELVQISSEVSRQTYSSIK